jgi:threonine dehydratase
MAVEIHQAFGIEMIYYFAAAWVISGWIATIYEAVKQCDEIRVSDVIEIFFISGVFGFIFALITITPIFLRCIKRCARSIRYIINEMPNPVIYRRKRNG